MENYIIPFLSCFFSMVIGYYLGRAHAKIKMIQNMADNPEALIETLKRIKELDGETGEALGVEVYAEERNNVWYLYNKETDQFLAQGVSLEKALDDAHDRFPGTNFWGLAHPE
jgi:hypothetical protein